MMSVKSGIFSFIIFLSLYANVAFGQACTTLGQTPATAFPACGTNNFEQNNVPLCATNSLFVPGCSGNGAANYENRNPFWYRFTCYASGTLAFVITPNDAGDDYDWQLYDVTGLNPDEVFTNQNIIISGNWAGNPGPTGASATGVDFIQCASPYDGNESRFAKTPNLIVGHEYILLVSHFTDSQSGYSLSFGGGTAVITNTVDPHLEKASSSCDGAKVTVKMNKKMKCSSLTASGSEFSLLPAVTTIVAAQAKNCSSSFDFDEVELTLAAPLPAGNYQLVINEGSDANSLLDNCERGIPDEQSAFSHIVPQPIPIDSVGKTGCAPNTIKLYFSKKIDCSTIAANGTNFSVTGTTIVNVIGASGNNCTDGLSNVIVVTFDSPIYTEGTYTVTPKLSVNGGAVRDECGKIIQPAPISFTTVDTVSADFTYSNDMGCRQDTLTFSHNGANDVNQWNWVFNNSITASTSSHTIIWPASSTNTIKLTVTNGVCIDSTIITHVLDNEVKVDFSMPDVTCPEDPLIMENLSTGLIDTWKWNYGTLRTILLQKPDPFYFPNTNVETDYIIKLTATNTTIGCSDSISKKIKVLKNCFIAVPSAFTPNNDGVNDFLSPTNALKADNLEFKVFNRWGQLVFSSRNWRDKWNGRIKGIEQNSGVYVWFLSYTHRDTGQKVFQRGTTMLIR